MLFYKNYIVYYNVHCYCGVFIEKYVCTKFHLDCRVSELHVPSVMYGLRLFIVVLQELHVSIEVGTTFCYSIHYGF